MPRPNVLLLLADQQRFDTIAAAGCPHMKTPNLDRLAREGMLCANAYSQNPVCMPARHDLLTGFPARVHGYYCNAEHTPIRDDGVPTLPRLLAHAGYRTAAVGKMHFFPTREHHGFGELHLMEELPRRRMDDEYADWLESEGLGEVQNLHGVRPLLYHTPQRAQMDAAHHGTHWVAQRASRWLRENGDEPFFLMCGFVHPHPPWDLPLEYAGLYDDVELPEPVALSRLPFEDGRRGAWFGDGDTRQQRLAVRRAYAAAVTMIDEAVGQLLQTLGELGQLDNTLVIYTSDHGEMLQDKGYYSKELPYEGAAHIPMLLRYPARIRPGSVREDFSDLCDLLPTCLDACGAAYPSGRMAPIGVSLLGEARRNEQCAATGLRPVRWVMCRDRRYKYVYHYIGGYEELYDLRQGEVENRLLGAQTPEIREAHRRLREKAVEYEARWGVEDGVVDGDFCPCAWEVLHPAVRGKHHFWANAQFQPFYEPRRGRGEVFLRELEVAAGHRDDLLDDPEWLESFRENFRRYSG